MPDWIPLERGAVCLDCKGIFDFAETKGKCPKCGTTIGWMLTKVDEKRGEDELRDTGRTERTEPGDGPQ